MKPRFSKRGGCWMVCYGSNEMQTGIPATDARTVKRLLADYPERVAECLSRLRIEGNRSPWS